MPSPKALTWSAWVSCVRFLRLRVDPVMTRAIFLSSTSMDTSTRCAPAASWNASAGVMLSSCGCCDGWLRTLRRLRTSGGRTGRESWGGDCETTTGRSNELFLIEKFIVPAGAQFNASIAGSYPLYLRKRTNNRRLGHVGFVPILLQKPAILAARLLARSLGTA